MSLLGSLLGGPGGSKPSAPTTPTGLPARSRDPPTQALKRELSSRPATAPSTNANGISSNGLRPVQPPLKRKASGEPEDPRSKPLRPDGTSGINGSSTSAPSTTSGYRGTAGLDRSKIPSRPLKPATGTPGAGAPLNPALSRPVTGPVQTATKPGPAAPGNKPIAPATQAAPKKGSYAEIMARASTAKTPVVTGIKNKAKEPIPIISSKKAKAEIQANAVKSKVDARKPGPPPKGKDGKSTLSASVDKTAPPKRKPVELAYKGTARPAPAPAAPAYKGTMGMARKDGGKPRPDDRRRGPPISKYAAANRRNEYLDDEELDELDDDDDMSAYGRDEEDDYYSDASSDMEANLYEVDQEEELALRAARKEDQAEQAKLDELERDKRARKQAALVKSLAEKKERRRFM